MARFIIKGGFGQAFRYDLAEGETVAGREPDNDLVLPNNSVSRKHVRFTRTAAEVSVEDLNSSNGIRVNGEKIGSVVISPGDTLSIGRFTLTRLAANETQFEGHYVEYLEEYTPAATAAKSRTTVARPELDTEQVLRDSELRLVRDDDPDQFWFVGSDPLTIGKAGVVKVGGLMSGGVIATLTKVDGVVVIERKKQFSTVSLNGQAIKQAQLKKGDKLVLGNATFSVGSGTKWAAQQG